MLAIAGGIGAAFMWATTALLSGRSSRLIGAASTLAWIMLIGTVAGVPLALASGPLPAFTAELGFWLAGASLGSVFGLLLVFRGMRIGKVGVVAALSSTEGAMAAVFSIVGGERLSLEVVATLAVIAVGVAAVALATDGEPAAHSGPGDERRAILYGSGAALLFGLSIFSTARLGESFTPFAAVMPPRILGVVAVTLPLALTGRLRISRPAVPLVAAIGAAELFGNASYVVGAQQSIAVAAVLASQFAAVAAIVAFLAFGERLSRHQVGGVAAIFVGVAMLAAFRA
jgi:drug/metabolite transporter (DMT)-like permease